MYLYRNLLQRSRRYETTTTLTLKSIEGFRLYSTTLQVGQLDPNSCLTFEVVTLLQEDWNDIAEYNLKFDSYVCSLNVI